MPDFTGLELGFKSFESSFKSLTHASVAKDQALITLNQAASVTLNQVSVASSWALEVFNKASNQASRAAGAAGALNKSLKGFQLGLRSYELGFRGFKFGLKSFKSGLRGFQSGLKATSQASRAFQCGIRNILSTKSR